jgi:hypothetical protein
MLKYIKSLFNRVNSQISFERDKNLLLKKEHMPKYFKQFTQYGEDQWELEFSLGNGLSVLFKNNGSLLYKSSGDAQSGYSTILYSENITIGELYRYVDVWSTEDYKLTLQREQKLDQLGI